MVSTVFATKLGMSQAWTTAGKRMPVTKCRVQNNIVVGSHAYSEETAILEVGFGKKKLKNMNKPQRTVLEKGKFTVGVAKMSGVKAPVAEAAQLVGTTLQVQDVLQVGDVVKVQGTTKGRGFAGAVKRHGFSGGPKTHGQSDRTRAVGSIGAGTSPGRVVKGKRMPGHYGVETKTVRNLTVLHVDVASQEIWLSGPVPGSISSIIRIEKTGENKKIEINKDASGVAPETISESQSQVETAAEVEVEAETVA